MHGTYFDSIKESLPFKKQYFDIFCVLQLKRFVERIKIFYMVLTKGFLLLNYLIRDYCKTRSIDFLFITKGAQIYYI
jgi:hypothetical protein